MKKMLKNLTIADFIDRLAAKNTPLGGGSASALNGLLAVGLIKMAVNHALASPYLRDHQETLENKRKSLDSLGSELAALIDRDSEALTELILTFTCKKKSGEGAAAWQNKMAASLEKAAEIPLETAKACLSALKICRDVLPIIDADLKSELMAGVISGHAGATGALMSSAINLGHLKDERLVSILKEEIHTAKTQADTLKKEAEKIVFRDYPFSILL